MKEKVLMLPLKLQAAPLKSCYVRYQADVPQSFGQPIKWIIPNPSTRGIFHRQTGKPNIFNTHAELMFWYSDEYVWLTDPILGRVSYNISIFEARWNLLGKQAIVLIKKWYLVFLVLLKHTTALSFVGLNDICLASKPWLFNSILISSRKSIGFSFNGLSEQLPFWSFLCSFSIFIFYFLS